jgi:hypothetical protein
MAIIEKIENDYQGENLEIARAYRYSILRRIHSDPGLGEGYLAKTGAACANAWR